MRFVARAPREGINVTDEHPLKEATILTVGLSAALALISLLIFSFVDIVVFFISPATEAKIFSDWTYADTLYIDYEDEVVPSLKALTERIASQWPESTYQFRLGILDDTKPNAIALPGGTILITRGLLDEVGSENELAFVIAHELGHFRNRDHLRMLGRGFSLGLVLAVLTGSDAGMLSSGIINIATFSFSQRQELEADEFALELVYSEYGHVAEATRFFERLQENRSSFEGIAGYFSTHPAPADRIERLRASAQSQGWPASGGTTPLTH